MFKMSPLAMVFNVAGLAAVLVVGGYAIHSMTASDDSPLCTGNYPAPTQLSLRAENGAPMTAIELQGRFGREEWGVLENVDVVRNGKQKGSEVLQVKLPAGTSSAFQSSAPQGGAGFSWLPESMQGATGACLSYRVRLPDDFEFANGGMLPGLFGGERVNPGSEIEGKSGFATRVMWGRDGAVALGSTSPVGGRAAEHQLNDAHMKLEKGRWVQITNEVVLNTPGENDGILRLWVDGELKIERGDILWRADDQLRISGVISDVAYGRFKETILSPKDSVLQISPFELSWK